jgi:drug/metabolite transporter (DMT)-like permease
MVVSAVAFLVNLTIVLTMKAHGQEITLRRESVLFLILAGLAAAGVDMFGLFAYNRGLKVTSSLIINATTTGIVLIVGFFALSEPVSGFRLAAIGLIAAGMLLLNAQGV